MKKTVIGIGCYNVKDLVAGNTNIARIKLNETQEAITSPVERWKFASNGNAVIETKNSVYMINVAQDVVNAKPKTRHVCPIGSLCNLSEILMGETFSAIILMDDSRILSTSPVEKWIACSNGNFAIETKNSIYTT